MSQFPWTEKRPLTNYTETFALQVVKKYPACYKNQMSRIALVSTATYV